MPKLLELQPLTPEAEALAARVSEILKNAKIGETVTLPPDLVQAINNSIRDATVPAILARRRMEWLHSRDACNVDGYEWGVFRVKWENGRAAEVWQTNSDFSDLDAAMDTSGVDVPAVRWCNRQAAAVPECDRCDGMCDPVKEVSRGVGGTDTSRPVTAQEDSFLREAAKRASKLVAPGKLAPGVMASDGYRTCEFCGCHTNAEVRACCEKGRAADGVQSTLKGQE